MRSYFSGLVLLSRFANIKCEGSFFARNMQHRNSSTRTWHSVRIVVKTAPSSTQVHLFLHLKTDLTFISTFSRTLFLDRISFQSQSSKRLLLLHFPS